MASDGDRTSGAGGDARLIAEFAALLAPLAGPEDQADSATLDSLTRDARSATRERWEDGRPKGWPTLQLRVRGKPFDIYCEHPSDVTLDGMGIPVINGQTAGRESLRCGWFDSTLAAHAAGR